MPRALGLIRRILFSPALDRALELSLGETLLRVDEALAQI
jgi:hypothetical protein